MADEYVLTIRLDDEHRQLLEALALKLDRSKNWVMRRALKEFAAQQGLTTLPSVSSPALPDKEDDDPLDLRADVQEFPALSKNPIPAPKPRIASRPTPPPPAAPAVRGKCPFSKNQRVRRIGGTLEGVVVKDYEDGSIDVFINPTIGRIPRSPWDQWESLDG